MNKIKRAVIMPYLMLCIIAILHSLVMVLLSKQHSLAWFGVIVALVPMVGFMAYLGASGTGRTSRYMPLQLTASLLGSALVYYDFSLLPGFYAFGLGLIGVNTYIFWYSNLGRPQAPGLQVGAVLPDFNLEDTEGQVITSARFRGSPTLLMFYRGNWCPLCVAQVREIAEQYRELQSRGVKVILVSPQPADNTRELAQRFDAPMTFAVDRDCAAAKQLNIFHDNAVPSNAGLDGYDSDSVYPTVVVTDDDNRVIWSDVTDNYRVRPEPALFLQVLDQYSAAATT